MERLHSALKVIIVPEEIHSPYPAHQGHITPSLERQVHSEFVYPAPLVHIAVLKAEIPALPLELPALQPAPRGHLIQIEMPYLFLVADYVQLEHPVPLLEYLPPYPVLQEHFLL
jgi:hypothetical protein